MKSDKEKVKIDGIDKKILRFLMSDARKPVLEIARKIGISGAAIHQRLRKLECHYTTGNWSILIKVLCKDNEHLMQVLNNKIQQIGGVSRTETFISLEQQIERQITI